MRAPKFFFIESVRLGEIDVLDYEVRVRVEHASFESFELLLFRTRPCAAMEDERFKAAAGPALQRVAKHRHVARVRERREREHDSAR